MSIEQNVVSGEIVQINGINYAGLDRINPDIKVHHLIYKIINTSNGHYYIGQHKTSNPTDKYMGSGRYIGNVLNKYPISLFIKEILFDFDNFDDMNNKEKELVPVNECYPSNPMSYNLIEGGNGQLTDEIKAHISKTLTGKMTGENNPMFGYHWSDEQRKHQSEVMKGRPVSDEFREKCRIRCSGEGNPMYGKHHTEETRKKLSKLRKGTQSGKNNPMYGLKCFTEEEKIQWRKNVGNGNRGKRRTEEFKRDMRNRAKLNPIKRMHDPKTGKIVNVPVENVQEFLNKGYVFGTGIASRKGKIGYCAGKRIMSSPDGIKKYIRIEDIQKYLDLGWKISRRSIPKELKGTLHFQVNDV